MCGDLIAGLFGAKPNKLPKTSPDAGETEETRRQKELLTQQRLDDREVELRQRNAALVGGLRSLVSGSAGGAGFSRALTRSKSDNA